METPLRVSTHQITIDASVEDLIEKEAAKLERYFNRIVGCHVTVEGSGNHHRHGVPNRVAIVVQVPGKDITVSHKEHEVLETAVRQAFTAAQRQLDEYARMRRDGSSPHERVAAHLESDSEPSSA